MPSFKRTRIAPTPSGYLHLGNILSFVITVAIARRSGASILLRIDDLDQDRVQSAYLHDIFDTLNFLELPWDEGPRDVKEFKQQYSQTHRLPQYQQALDHLEATGAVFACTCSRSQLQAHDSYPGTCIPLHLPLNTPAANWRLNEPPYVVIRKKDGRPAYQLSSVIDDLFFDVDLVVRGNDLWPSTQAQLTLANYLPANDFAGIQFYHHPLITDASGKKLSKSAGATSIHFLRKQGLKKEDVYQLLGPGQDWETLALQLEYLQTGAGNL